MTGPAVVWSARADVVVVGTGVAGLTAALDSAAAGLQVLLVTKHGPAESNTRWAQGGVAVVRDERDPGDSVGAHIEDTLVAGAGLCDPRAVTEILEAGPDAIARLQRRGALFDQGPHGLLRTREGGHSANRVIHAGGDATGSEIERALLAANGLPGVLADHLMLDVLVCDGRAVGISVLDSDGRVGLIRAGAVVLATGGAGHVYSSTTNPGVATADGLAAALRAGAELSDVEFLQFHPTVLWTGPEERGHRPLVTEAVRGEGAVLIDGAGARVMAGVHPLEDLAPRDVVSLAITRRMAQNPGGISDHVFLDATRIGRETFLRRFPTVSAACRAAGIDPSTDPIPVAPAAHYHCGGVKTDLSGQTTIPGLYAAGEVARTGLHGANRLASNSLLEGLVMGEQVAATVLARRDPIFDGEIAVPAADVREPGSRAPLQAAMSAHAAIGRTEGGLVATLELSRRRRSAALNHETVEAANLALASEALLTAALTRAESRGCHVRIDAPETSGEWATRIDLSLIDGELTAAAADRRVSAVTA